MYQRGCDVSGEVEVYEVGEVGGERAYEKVTGEVDVLESLTREDGGSMELMKLL